MSKNVRKVADLYQIDEDELYLRAERGDEYWERSQEFFLSVKDQDVSSLSDKQEQWLDQIESRLNS